ncbi:MAG: arginyltransferase [Rhodospirillaceae bacterium]|jgi:leucyl-tRNA---protein transferase|nr:arginyltransferase [Rhodospirillaceae bacterium]
MEQTPLKRPQFFYTTAPLPCPYLSDRLERKLVTELAGPVSDILHEGLAKSGFRRSHSIAYAPACPGCKACVPVRVDVKNFERRRSLARIWKRNAHITTHVVPARATSEQFELFTEYQHSRHSSSDMANMGFYEYSAMIEDSPIETYLVEYRTPQSDLVGVCLTDQTDDGLSAVYSFFSSEPEHSGLGNFVVLWLIDHARTLNLPYVYLGYWIAESPKMAYKTRFQPLEELGPEGWQPLEADENPS